MITRFSWECLLPRRLRGADISAFHLGKLEQPISPRSKLSRLQEELVESGLYMIRQPENGRYCYPHYVHFQLSSGIDMMHTVQSE